jgi:hypothetical protein
MPSRLPPAEWISIQRGQPNQHSNFDLCELFQNGWHRATRSVVNIHPKCQFEQLGIVCTDPGCKVNSASASFSQPINDARTETPLHCREHLSCDSYMDTLSLDEMLIRSFSLPQDNCGARIAFLPTSFNVLTGISRLSHHRRRSSPGGEK